MDDPAPTPPLHRPPPADPGRAPLGGTPLIPFLASHVRSTARDAALARRAELRASGDTADHDDAQLLSRLIDEREYWEGAYRTLAAGARDIQAETTTMREERDDARDLLWAVEREWIASVRRGDHEADQACDSREQEQLWRARLATLRAAVRSHLPAHADSVTGRRCRASDAELPAVVADAGSALRSLASAVADAPQGVLGLAAERLARLVLAGFAAAADLEAEADPRERMSLEVGDAAAAAAAGAGAP